MATLPELVLVHGAWSTPKVYDRYITSLRAAGYIVHCPLLPTCSNNPSTFADDVATVRDLVSSLVAKSTPVVLLMHSYGGTVGSSALSGLSAVHRAKQGLDGGVIHLLYLSAYILPVGSSIVSIVKRVGVWDRWHQVIDVREDGTTFPKDPKNLVLGGLSAAEQEMYVKRLVRFPGEPFEVEMAETPWKIIPTTYVYTELDRCVPPLYQDLMLEMVREAGVEVRAERFSSGHVVFLTHTEEMVGVVNRAVKGIGG